MFDLDLETEEGSEGEGEPEFSPAVSGPPGRSSIPARSHHPGGGINRATPAPPPAPRVGSSPADPGLSKIPATIRF